MTGKDLQKLRRQDILQLLLAQSRETARLQAEQQDLEEELLRIEKNNEHLTRRLSEKDVLNHKLKGRLEEKDRRIIELETESELWTVHKEKVIDEAGSVADAALQLNGVFDAVQRAADQYLYNIKQRCEALADRLYQDSEEGSDWISGWDSNGREDM